jgi:hypothetical protein
MKKKSLKLKNVEDQKKINPVGRPTSYNKELGDEICLAISTSVDGLRKLTAKYPHFPTISTICEWVIKNPEFSVQYARARAFQADFQADWAMEVALDGSNDTIIDENGNERCNHEWISRSRLIVDTIKWRASKLVPKVYGDKLETMQNVSITEKVVRIKNAKKAYETK